VSESSGASESNDALRALEQLAARLARALPESVRELDAEIGARLARIPATLNEYGVDRFGMEPRAAQRQLLLSALLYKHYFRVDARGFEHVPEGRVLLIANHAGQLPFDGAMLIVAMLLEAEPPRLARGLGEFWIPRLPFISEIATRGGSLVGTPENFRALIDAEECVMVFPEGVRGMNKPYRERYRLQRFGTGFVRLALETQTPVVPVGIVGSEEQAPGLFDVKPLARLLGMPAFPITPTFPLLGPLGLLPLPVKYRIRLGPPIRFIGSANADDATIESHVADVKTAIDRLLETGRRERRNPFF
jgi:1-acyl-sn-glycerol-3-phosphate acyltransferase